MYSYIGNVQGFYLKLVLLNPEVGRIKKLLFFIFYKKKHYLQNSVRIEV